MTITQIRKLQVKNGIAKLQAMIENGLAWKLEGHVGRQAMRALEDGACFLPLKAIKDYWGNTVPARTMLQAGSKGTIENCTKYYEGL